jgi:hypothetical protein
LAGSSPSPISPTVTPDPSIRGVMLCSVPAVEPFIVLGAVCVSCRASGSSSGSVAVPQTTLPVWGGAVNGARASPLSAADDETDDAAGGETCCGSEILNVTFG